MIITVSEIIMITDDIPIRVISDISILESDEKKL
jgi:hypothetical protein